MRATRGHFALLAARQRLARNATFLSPGIPGSSSQYCAPRSFSSSSRTSLPPPPAAVSNTSAIMANEAQLGRHFYLNKVLEHWASRPSTRLTLRQLLFFGRSLGRDPEKILKSANYVREELPIRIAQRIRDMQNLPYVVMTNKQLEAVYQLYWKAFDKFRRWPVIRTHEENDKYVAQLKEALEDHLTVIPSLALGMIEVSEHMPPDQLENFMQRMLKSRISRRVLAEQHIALTEALDDPFAFFSPEPAPMEPESIGIIHTHLPVKTIISECISLLTHVLAKQAGVSVQEAIERKIVPEVVIDGDLDAKITYIPEHLNFILFELIKDSMRAVMRYKPEERDETPLRATIVEGPPEDDMIIRISDCGGGVSDLVSRVASTGKVVPGSIVGTGIGNMSDASIAAAARAPPGTAVSTMPTTTVHKDAALASSPSYFSPLATTSAAADWENGPIALDILHQPAGWPSGATSPVSMTSISTLTDVLCSFSNVRRRLELEEEARREQEQLALSSSEGQRSSESRQMTAQPATSPTKTANAALLGASAQAGLGSRSKLEHLRKIGKFKGTVQEQVQTQNRTDQSPLDGDSPGSDPASGRTLSSSEALADSMMWREAPKQPNDTVMSVERIEPRLSDKQLNQTADTGLGLPLARVYAEFFGGSLNFRSLDSHGTDVYVRVPKLGVVAEGGEEKL